MDDNDNEGRESEVADGRDRDDRTQAFDAGLVEATDDDTDISSSWKSIGATRGPRSPAEGVRIIGAEEAASAIETGQAAPRMPDNAPKFGDVPEPPRGPRPSIRFPGSDPATLAKPPVVEPPPLRNLWDSPSSEPDRPPVPSGTTPPAGGRDIPRVGRFEELVARDRPASAESPSYGRMPEPTMSEPTMSQPSLPDPSLPNPSLLNDLRPVAEPPAWDLFDDPALSAHGDDLFGPAEDPLSFPSSAAGRFSEPVAADRSSVSESPGWQDPPAREREQASMALPHWTEPPSGEVPRLLPDSVFPESAGAEDPSSWSTLSTGPRWRDQPTDWDDSDFHEALGEDISARVGALREPAAVDEDPVSMVPTGAPSRAAARPDRAAAAGSATRTRGPVDTAPRERDYGQSPPMPRRSANRGNDDMSSNGGPPGADIGTRVVTGLIAAGVALACAAIGPRALVPLITIALVLAAAELHQALRAGGYQPATLLGLVATASVVGAAYWKGEQALPLILTLVLVFSFLWYLIGVVHARPAVNVAVTVMAFVYIGFLGSYAALMLKFPNGVGLLLGAVVATVAHDVGSYFAGRMGGRTPLAPAISPNKTFEGLVGGTFATLFVCLLVVRAMDPPWTTGRAFWLAVVVSIVSPLGDLCESLIKRDLGVKDMGKILPGHGGVLDRIDALIFVIPATYYLARVMDIF